MKPVKLLFVLFALLTLSCQDNSPKISESEKLTNTFLKSREFSLLGVSGNDLNSSSAEIGVTQNGLKKAIFSTKKPSSKVVGAFFNEDGKIGIAYSGEYIAENAQPVQTMETVSYDLENKKFNGKLFIKLAYEDYTKEFTIAFKNSELVIPDNARLGPNEIFDCASGALYSLGSKNLVGKLFCFASLGSCMAESFASCAWDAL